MMPVWPDALIGDTLHLSAEQFGAYLLLLFATWRNNGKPLPDDDRKLARICRCSLAHWRRALRPTVIEFFQIDDGFLHQLRLESEWNFVLKTRAIRAIFGSAGGRAKALKMPNSGIAKATILLEKNPSKTVATHTLKKKERESLEDVTAHARVIGSSDTKTRPSLKILEKNQEGEAEPRQSPGEIPEGWLAAAEAARDEAQLEPVNLLLEWGKFAARADGPVELRRWIEWSLRAWVSRAPKAQPNGTVPAEAVAETPWAARMRQWQIDGWWLPSFGPKPGEPGCFVPPEYLAEAAE
jgi:uncharacterized protein YdaU (DUF1376 family)